MSLRAVLNKHLPNHTPPPDGTMRRLEDADFQAHARVTMAAAMREGWAEVIPKKRASGLTCNPVTINGDIAAAAKERLSKTDDAIRNRTRHEPEQPPPARTGGVACPAEATAD